MRACGPSMLPRRSPGTTGESFTPPSILLQHGPVWGAAHRIGRHSSRGPPRVCRPWRPRCLVCMAGIRASTCREVETLALSRHPSWRPAPISPCIRTMPSPAIWTRRRLLWPPCPRLRGTSLGTFRPAARCSRPRSPRSLAHGPGMTTPRACVRVRSSAISHRPVWMRTRELLSVASVARLPTDSSIQEMWKRSSPCRRKGVCVVSRRPSSPDRRPSRARRWKHVPSSSSMSWKSCEESRPEGIPVRRCSTSTTCVSACDGGAPPRKSSARCHHCSRPPLFRQLWP